MNNDHLSNKKIYSMIVEPKTIDENLQLHLKKCHYCQKRLIKMKGFLKAYQEKIENAEINWTREKGKILSAVSNHQSPAYRLRWATAVVFSFIIVISAVLVHQIYFQPGNGSTIEETELQQEMWLFEESIPKVEFPQSIVLLTEWGEENFQQFLNFFLPIEEERNEKNNSTTNSIHSNRFSQPIPA